MAAGVVTQPVMRPGNADLGIVFKFTASNNETDNVLMMNPDAKGIKVVVDITAVTTTTCTVTIEGVDGASGKHYTILASTALGSVATTVLTVYPGLTAAANVTVNDHLPPRFNIKAVLSNGTSLTGTIGVSMLY